jgi:gliding motility-associated-like protein
MKEEMESKSKLGEAFAEGFKDLKLEPSADVWAQVSQHTPKPAPGLTAGVKTALIAASTVVIVSVLAVLYFTNQKTVSTQIEPITPMKNNIAQAPVQQKQETPIVSMDTLTTPKHSSAPKSSADNSMNNEPTNQQIIMETPVEPVSNPATKSDSSSETVNESFSSSSMENFTDVQSSGQNESSTSITTQPSSTLEENVEVTSPKRDIDTTISYTEDMIICIGEPTRLVVKGGKYYSWSTGEASSSIVVEPKKNVSYTVTVTDKYAHKHVHEFNVRIDEECTTIFVPNAFSPGGYNNVKFKAYATNLQSFRMQIFNRNGQLMFNTTDINSGWDGTFNGTPLKSQSFVYIIEYVNGRGVRNIKKGQFTLIR